MYRKRLISITLLACLSIVLVSSGVLAQGQSPPGDPEPPSRDKDQKHPIRRGNPRYSSEKDRDATERLEKMRAPLNSEYTGGPDDYGYTWDDGVAYSWEITSTDTGITGDDDLSLVNIGFSFPFYKQTWSEVYVTTNGILVFRIPHSGCCGGFDFPSPSRPNNVIAPFSEDLTVGGGYNFGGIFTTSGGSAPNHYFVIEWRDVTVDGNDFGDEYTFQVILHENGDIVFQYSEISYTWWDYTVGIEDSRGLDGLEYPFVVSDGLAVRFYRPDPMARVQLYPSNQGSFTERGETLTYDLSVRNTGDIGLDTYDLTTSSVWPATLYMADTITLLTDTDGDGVVDTGPVAQGASTIIIAKVKVPGLTNVGDGNIASITATSSLNPAKSKTATIEASIPAPFAQVFFSDATDGAMSIYLVQPHSQVIKKASPAIPRPYPAGHWGADMAVAETPGFAYVWSQYTGLGPQAKQIEYTLLDDAGDVTHPVSILSNPVAPPGSNWDYNPTVAVAPNGNIGVIWMRYLTRYLNDTTQENYNIWFAILNPSGDVISGPTNLTNNNVWGTWDEDDTDVPWFYQPVITASGDNRFVLSWTERYDAGGECTWSCSVGNIYYAVYDSSGIEIKSIQQLTDDAPEQDKRHIYSNLTSLSGNRALLAWECHDDNLNYDWDICYVVLDSGGGLVKDITNASNTYDSSFNMDAVQLSGGNSVIAWSELWDDQYQIAYVLLDASYSVITSRILLSHPAAVTGNKFPSVAASDDRAVLTWMDSDRNYRRHLYYALVDSNGSVLSEPMIFLNTQDEEYPYIETSYVGYGNTSYTITPTDPLVDAYIHALARVSTSPGGVGTVPVSFGNNGATTATSVVITATLGAQLNYIGDTSGIVPIVDGNGLTWNLPTDLSFLGSGQFSLRIRAPDAPYGSQYPLKLGISSEGPEGEPADNTTSVSIMIARHLYFPVGIMPLPAGINR